MSDIAQKSVGFLIDELITTSMKCWYAQEAVIRRGTDSEIAKGAIAAQELNNRRNLLICAIDKRLGESDISPTTKSYGVKNA